MLFMAQKKVVLRLNTLEFWANTVVFRANTAVSGGNYSGI